jgi:hypothetical protein
VRQRRPASAALPNVFLCGDWVGDEGMLLDAALASARQAAQLACQAVATPKAA